MVSTRFRLRGHSGGTARAKDLGLGRRAYSALTEILHRFAPQDSRPSGKVPGLLSPTAPVSIGYPQPPRHVDASPEAWMPETEAMIDLRGITKVYDTAAGPFPALKGIDLQVYPGEFVAVVGRSGSGKSTLINMFTGIDHPTAGEVVVAQTPIRHLNEGQMAEWRGRNLGIVFQFFQLLPTLTLAENVMLPMDLCNLYEPGQRYERALHLLDQVDIATDADKFPAAVSGGHQQRAAIARALANDPPILVADEPTGNLDSRAAEAVFQLFEALVAGGKTILMVTHDDELASRAQRTLTLADGEFVAEAIRAPLVAWLPVLPVADGLRHTS